MRRIVLASLVAALAVFTLGSSSASACGGYGYSSYYRGASYRSYYAPRFAYGGFYRPRVWGFRGWGGWGWGWRGGRRW